MAVRERTAHSTTQAFGLALMAGVMIGVTILTPLLLDTDDSFWPVAAIATVVTWVVWQFDGVWARILGILGTLAVGFSAFFLAFGVFQVFSPIEFILGLAFFLGFFISLIAGIMALVASRKGKVAPTPRATRFRQEVLGILGVASVISIVGFFLTQTTVSDAEAQGTATLEMTNFEFEPQTTSVLSGQGLLIANNDAFAHDFTLDDFDIYVYFGPGSEAVIDLSTVPPGTYDYFCSLHSEGDDPMTGTITVEG